MKRLGGRETESARETETESASLIESERVHLRELNECVLSNKCVLNRHSSRVSIRFWYLPKTKLNQAC